MKLLLSAMFKNVVELVLHTAWRGYGRAHLNCVACGILWPVCHKVRRLCRLNVRRVSPEHPHVHAHHDRHHEHEHEHQHNDNH